MGSRPNMNMLDPAEQEKIRRKPHEYQAGVGNHGSYVERPYHHQEFPKMMDRTPAPKYAQFKGQPDAQEKFEQSRKEWEAQMEASIVNNRAEEQAWIAAHVTDPPGVSRPAKGAAATDAPAKPARGKGKGKAA